MKIEKAKLLIVEGRDEEFFFGALLEKHLQKQDVQVLGVGGKQQIADNLQALVRDPRYPEVETIAVVRDADAAKPDSRVPAAQSAWDSVTGAMHKAGIPVPDEHGKFASGPPRSGVFILPDGQADGMLETLCIAAIAHQPAYKCVEAYFECLEKLDIRQKTRAKAWAYAYLASCEEAGKRLGEAAQAGYWPWQAPAFGSIKAFLAQM